MIDALGVITNKPDHLILDTLTKDRNINTIPIGGKYKLIDFPLSNMVNTGLKKIGVMGNHRYKSLVEHLGTGQEWSLNRKNKGLSILHQSNNLFFDSIPQINLMDFQANLEFFEDSNRQDIIISSSHIIANMDYRKVLSFHRKRKADITLIYAPKPLESTEPKDDLYVCLDPLQDGRVADFSTDMQDCPSNLFMDMLIIKRDLLLTILDECKRHSLSWDLMRLLRYNTGRFNIYAFPYKGYYCKINSTKQYFKCNMDLLNPAIKNELFNGEQKIHTNIKDNHPTRYLYGTKVMNSLISSGCQLEGHVDQSIISRKVHVEAGSHIENSIIMNHCHIGKNVTLENVILDRNVVIRDNLVLKGRPDAPIVIGKGHTLG